MPLGSWLLAATECW